MTSEAAALDALTRASAASSRESQLRGEDSKAPQRPTRFSAVVGPALVRGSRLLHELKRPLERLTRRVTRAGRGRVKPQDFVLYRGIKNARLGDSFFQDDGGTGYGPMSTSRDVKVALMYTRPEPGDRSPCHSVIIMRLNPASFMEQGVDLSFLSCFPQEHEYLYPPLTFLRKTGEPIFFKFEETQYEVIDVAPSYPS